MWKDISTNSSIEDVPSGATGFVYEFIFTDGKRYIGKKSFFTTRKRKFGKKESALITDKRKKLYEYVTKESDWRTYASSNVDVKARIKNGDPHVKLILGYASDKKQLTYLEEYFLYTRSAIIKENYYNNCIAGRFYTKDAMEWG